MMRRGRRGGPGPRRGPAPRRRGPAPRARRQVQRKQRRRRRRRVALVGGLLAFGAYKLSKRDAKRVEEHTGKPPEELTDQEMEQAMNDLGIEKQQVSEQDQQYIDDQGGEWEEYEDYEDEEPSYLDELERLGQLKDQGIITDEEFQAKKKQLLGL